jgi:hypothetical protein
MTGPVKRACLARENQVTLSGVVFMELIALRAHGSDMSLMREESSFPLVECRD